jgi:hypothetical protein
MFQALDSPFLILVLSLAVFWAAALLGKWFRKRTRGVNDEHHGDFIFVLGSALTLLGLIIGFTFSMAVSRYDQRKNDEEQEANAIGTLYIRADFLPSAEAARARSLLTDYVNHRIHDYSLRDKQQLRQSDAQTARMQNEMWSAVATPAATHPTVLTALTVASLNDVLSAQSYTQAAWRNRIPRSAWALLVLISIFCNGLMGYIANVRSALLLLILPIVLSISFFLIADIDSPRGGGVIHVGPQNLQSLAESLHSQQIQ